MTTSYSTAPTPFLSKGLFGWVLFIALACMIFLLLKTKGSRYDVIALSDFQNRLELDKVDWVSIDHDELHGQFRRPETIDGKQVQQFRVTLPAGTSASWEFNQWLLENRHDARVSSDNSDSLLINIVVPLIPWILILAFVWFFVFRNLRKVQNVRPSQAIPVYIVPQPGGETKETP